MRVDPGRGERPHDVHVNIYPSLPPGKALVIVARDGGATCWLVNRMTADAAANVLTALEKEAGNGR